MSSETDDPATAPNPSKWSALGEEERLQLVLRYHRRAGIALPNEKLHAAIHVTIENQIVLGDELAVRRAVERLMTEGLDRHEALHAVGLVLSEHLAGIARGGADTFPVQAYNAEVEQVTAEGWRRLWEGQDDPQ